MINVIKAASYICNRYKAEKKERIDEMKLHKLLYFAQRESIVLKGIPMFQDEFEAWKYGPVMVTIRQRFHDDNLNVSLSREEKNQITDVFDSVFCRYASKNSWSLSTLSHGEYSWQKARLGYSEDDSCNVHIKVEDIRRDAERIKIRRMLYS